MKYWYTYQFRGFSPGCQPSGFIDKDHSIGNMGAIAYDRELTKVEMDDYELEYYSKEVMT